MTEDLNKYISERIKQARQQKGISQRKLALLSGSAQGTISDYEIGRIRVNAAELARLAAALEKPITFFFPGADASQLTGKEFALLQEFRNLTEPWQDGVLTTVRTQVALFKGMRNAEDAEITIPQLPKDEQEDAAYAAFYKVLEPLLSLGLKIEFDENGNVYLGHGEVRVPVPIPCDDDRDKAILLEIQQRFFSRQTNGL